MPYRIHVNVSDKTVDSGAKYSELPPPTCPLVAAELQSRQLQPCSALPLSDSGSALQSYPDLHAYLHNFYKLEAGILHFDAVAGDCRLRELLDCNCKLRRLLRFLGKHYNCDSDAWSVVI